jgi:selenide,water dikinase
VRARISVRRVPLLPDVVALAEAGMVPGGTKRNLRANAPTVRWHPAITDTMKAVISDAQTSGGLLVATPDAEALLARLREAGVAEAATIGEIVAEDPLGVIEVEP